MKMKHLWLALCVIGVILPYSQLIPWTIENGANPLPMFAAVFADHATAFFGFDLMVTALVFLAFAVSDGLRNRIRLFWLAIAAVFLVGVSLGMPLYLYLREISLDSEPDSVPG